jgi:hypothetical protein
MKKSLLSLLLLSVTGLFGYSQSLSLSNSSGPIEPNSTIIQAGTPDSVELVTYLHVKNTGAAAIEVLCKKLELSMLDSTEVTICWAGGCYPPGTFVSPNFQPMAPGETNTEFVGHYTQIAFKPLKPGESVVRWVFYDRNNTNDSVSVTVKYTSFPMSIGKPLANRGTLSSPYPNPASVNTSFSYSIPAGSQGEIVIRDIVGAEMTRQMLTATGGKTSINVLTLRDGIYFCSLLIDGQISQTKKLIVKQ